MDREAPKIRLCVADPLGPGAVLRLDAAQSHYLATVMRLKAGDQVALFNGRDGEWRAEITEAARRTVSLTCGECLRPQTSGPDLWLLFAPVKKARTDWIVEKATELGVSALQPVQTVRTIAARIKAERFAAIAREAAEQCGRLDLPEIRPQVPLDRLLDDWPTGRGLMFCDTASASSDPAAALTAAGPGPWAVLVGPEGGFAPNEAARLRDLDFATPVTLGPRTLRADTAVTAALGLWQACLGDWSDNFGDG